MSFFTIAGIEDEKLPPDHPDVIKFFDRRSAEELLKAIRRCGDPLEGCFVAEHES
jgi:hypothetical protein